MRLNRRNGFIAGLLVLLLFLLMGAQSASALGSVSLNWQASPDPRTTGYLLFYGTASGDYSQSIDVGNVAQAVLSDLTEGQTYYFVVMAYGQGTLQSVFSNEAIYQVPAKGGGASVGASSSGVPSGITPGTSLGTTATQVWFRIQCSGRPQVWESADLVSGNWHEVPAQAIVNLGGGVYEIRVPKSQAASQAFFRFATEQAGN